MYLFLLTYKKNRVRQICLTRFYFTNENRKEGKSMKRIKQLLGISLLVMFAFFFSKGVWAEEAYMENNQDYDLVVQRITSALLAHVNGYQISLLDSKGNSIVDASLGSESRVNDGKALVREALEQVLERYPEAYGLLANKVQISIATDGSYLIYHYPESQSTYLSRLRVLKNKCGNILQEIENNPSIDTDFEKVLYVHDYIIKESAYDDSEDLEITYSNSNAYSALVYGKSVCTGYTLSARVLLEKLGVETKYVRSNTLSHAWNMVKINGNWYHMDLTWDDSNPDVKGLVSYKYFLLNDEEILAADNSRTPHLGYIVSDTLSTSTLFSGLRRGNNSVQFFSYYRNRWYYLENDKIYETIDWYGSEPSIYSGSLVGLDTDLEVPVNGVSIREDKLTMEEADTYQPSYSLLPIYHTDSPAVSYTSSNTSVVEVDSNGCLKAKKAGSAIVTFSCGDYSDSLAITVKAQNVSVSATYTMGKGEVLKIKASADTSAIWKSTNKKVVSISKKGKMTAKKKGTAYIQARNSAGKILVKCKVVVKNAPKKVKVEESYITVKKGKTFKNKVTFNKKGYSNSLVFQFSKSGIVALKKGTTFKALSKGLVKVKVTTYNKKTTSFWVKVK